MGWISAPFKNWREPVCCYIPVAVAERAGHAGPYITVSGIRMLRHERTVYNTFEDAEKNQTAVTNQGRKTTRPERTNEQAVAAA